ncbi:phosphate signaling complex protein PhoU [Azospirillum halopraeferens]|uniref:phosphate signaling complex protein PhoU n=1 Tax=Azospirillum halopraeferens TaxID=34010 RepID=UPI00040D58AB|nr:phosphate signaling complex protein PhoU [Azospirillum halopraeferens]
MTGGHTVVAFDAEMRRLHGTVERMGRLAEEQLATALRAIAGVDADLAAEVIRRDPEIDRMEAEVESLAIRLLALRQPMARDLREIVAAFKVASNIERIGDFAASVAKRTVTLSGLPGAAPVQSLAPIGEMVVAMVRDVVTAYVDQDATLALDVRNRDTRVDHAYTALFREFLTYMMESPQHITGCTHLLFVAKSIERIGDHATNVAENVCFLVQGHAPADERDKDDRSSFVMPEPPDTTP